MSTGRPQYKSTERAANAIATYNRQRTKTQVELAEKYRLENAITKGELVRKSEIAKGLAAIADAMTSRILAAAIPRSLQEDLLAQLAGLPLVLEQTVHAQTRLKIKTQKTPKAGNSPAATAQSASNR